MVFGQPPIRRLREGLQWRANLAPSLVVFLISLPLSMGIASVSGVAPERGLLTAIVGGLVVGSLTGSRLQISGPSAGSAIMVLEVVQGHGLSVLPVVVLLMGALQLVLGIARLGQVFRAVVPAVVDGMLAGIGVLLFSGQFHVMVDDTSKGSGWANLVTLPQAVVKGVLAMDGSSHQWAALVGTFTLAVFVGVSRARFRLLRLVPAPLAAVVSGTALAWWIDVPIKRVQVGDNLLAAMAPPSWEDLALLASPAVLLSALALAFVASAETLLCTTAIDAMHEGPRANYDRELLAQGVGNALCGALGALPTTGVITRSSANVAAGATSPASAMLVGVWLGLLCLLAPEMLGIIPQSCLAGLLVFVGYRLVRTRPLRALRWYGRSELAIFASTLVTIVVVDLLTGIVVGLGLAIGKVVFSQGLHFHHLTTRVVYDDALQRVHVYLEGTASFVRLPRLASLLESLPATHEVHLHVEKLQFIDHACLDLLEKWEAERTRARSPVRVEWNKLRHRYHAGNVLDPTPEEHSQPLQQEVKLLDFITPSCILIEPALTGRFQAIEMLGQHLARIHPELDAHYVIASATRREHEASTCMGHGLMVPHARVESSPFIRGVIALSRRGWDFGAPDGGRIQCVVLLCTPEQEATRHLAALAAFARLFMLTRELKDRWVASSSSEEAFRILNDARAKWINYPLDAESAQLASAPKDGVEPDGATAA